MTADNIPGGAPVTLRVAWSVRLEDGAFYVVETIGSAHYEFGPMVAGSVTAFTRARREHVSAEVERLKTAMVEGFARLNGPASFHRFAVGVSVPEPDPSSERERDARNTKIAGWRARRLGCARSANPYRSGFFLYHDWDCGWALADAGDPEPS